MNPYRVPGESATEEIALAHVKIDRFTGSGCHACRFVVGCDGVYSPQVTYTCVASKGHLQAPAGDRVAESFYVCEICQSIWGKVVHR